ncbi:3-oxoadipate enol-lactonase [Cnuella takakiae]|uniref:3-oxoadipate enol-lactonase n=1 Tax=Cnuella takakiae TaxID=1302690 RepID=A0A1M5DVV4_9BACT|nr:3-oxoadipate enol-lactonase [Cnuella takakiae]OLY93851.1 3-oxoadipate enol-lactonase [Cnuella takakiae]SHF70971.1 3-oxoadipate enol-lactonase [Cnuella takakiae]
MQFCSFQNQSIHYQYLPGAGVRNFVFANSLGTDFRIWDEVVTRLLPHGSVLRFDKPGHGLSESGSGGGVEWYGQLVLALMDAHGIDRCVFVGLSIGGLMGQWLALRHPKRIEKLVLSNTAARIGELPYWIDRIATIKAGGIAPLADMILGRWLAPSFLQNNTATVAGMKRMLEGCALPGYVQACATLRDTDFSGQLQSISLPTLCIAGNADGAIPLADMETLAAVIPAASLRVLEGVGHIPCVEVPKIFADAVLDFVHSKLSV